MQRRKLLWAISGLVIAAVCWGTTPIIVALAQQGRTIVLFLPQVNVVNDQEAAVNTAVPLLTTPTVLPVTAMPLTATPEVLPPAQLESVAMTHVDASVEPFIAICPQQQVLFGTLRPGLNTTTAFIDISSNNNYVVGVYDEYKNPATDWHMTQWQSTQQEFLSSSLKLSEPLRISSDQHEVTAGTSAVIISGKVDDQNDGNGQRFITTYSQMLRDEDAALPPGYSYHLVLVWRAFISI